MESPLEGARVAEPSFEGARVAEPSFDGSHVAESPFDSSQLLARSVEILRVKPYVFACSVSAEGEASVRQIQPLEITDDLEVWFATSRWSRKVREILRSGRLTLASDDLDTLSAVTMVGAARVIDDIAARQGRWVEQMRQFFPGGPAGDDYVLVHVRADRAEVIDYVQGITPPPFGLVPAVVVRRDGRWDVVDADRYDSGR